MLQDSLEPQVDAEGANAAPDRPLPSGAPWPSRALDVIFLLVTLATLPAVAWGGGTPGKSSLSDGAILLVLLGASWILIGLLWSFVRIRRIRSSRKGDPNWTARLAGLRVTRLITIGTAIIVLDSGVNIITYKGDDANATAIRVISIGMVLVAWTMLQLAYTERYARMDLENTGETPHLEFPATERPTLLEYAYFSFTVGTTFATSDVNVQTSRMRGVVLCHGLLSFVYNTAVLGMVLSLISG